MLKIAMSLSGITVAVATDADRQVVAEAVIELVREKSRLSGPERKIASA